MCVRSCPEGCIFQKAGEVPNIDLDYCKGCGLCAKVCPVKAIAMKDKREE
jgi:pyruvate ferredoxin oxidoreductase delta subunit